MRFSVLLVFIFFGCFLSPVVSQGQGLGWFKTSKAIRSLKTAQRLIGEGKYEAARVELEQTIRIKSNFAVAHREMGKVQLLLKNYSASIKAYEKSFELNPRLSRAAYYECGEAYFYLSRFDTAAIYFSQYDIMKDSRYTNAKKEAALEQTHDASVERRKRNYLFALEAIANPTLGIGEGPFNLSKLINTPYDEYLPSISGDGLALIYTTTQSYDPLHPNTGENIFISKKLNKEWQLGQTFNPLINTPSNEGMAKYAADERYAYFAGCQRLDGKGGCDLYLAQLENNQLVQVQALPGDINSSFWDSQPSISCDGMVMYFSSSREGGYGGADIWVSFRKQSGEWTEAENLGPEINTPNDEEAPFISPDGVTLFFASDGHDGMGDSDLFMSRLDQVNDTIWEWREPLNLGYPINSPFREVGIFVKPDGKTTYFASNRLGGQGGLDIYEFTMPDDFRPYEMVLLEGQIKDEFAETPVEVSLDIMRNGNKWEVKTDENGWYFICLPSQKAYAFQVNNNSYEYFMEAAFLPAQDNAIPFRFDISLIPKRRPNLAISELDPREISFSVYFSFDDFALDEKARGQLSEIVEKLSTESGWQVEIVGYTDNVGNVAYNQMLSEQRAKAVVQYLNNSGIKIKTIRIEGRGAVSSATGVETEDERAKHRRVEVLIKK